MSKRDAPMDVSGDGGRGGGGGGGGGGGRRRDRDSGGGSSFSQARERFERKRKSYPSDNNRGGGGGGGRGGGGYDRDRDRGGYDDYNDRSKGQRRSRSPSRWERGKKQQKKTQTDVPPDRELFVGNIPSNIDDRFLLNFLNGAMRHANLCPRHETPCLSCQINSSNFAFVEMLNVDYANKCLNLNGILFLNSRVKVGRPKKYAGPFVVAKTWQELTGDTLTIDAVLDSESEKVNRELFIGNTTPEMTDQMLKDFLGTAMEQVGLTIMDGNPITVCEMFGKYAFIEMRTPREATNALNMDNILFMNTNLQITRPAKYKGAFEEHCQWEHILARYDMKPEEFQLGQILAPSVMKAATIPIKKGKTGDGDAMDDGNEEEENIHVVKAELVQVKRALEITRHQLDESNKKSEARKEQLVSLNKKWAEGKTELTEHRQELEQVKDELTKNTKFGSSANGNVSVNVDMDSRLEAQELKKKHEETQGMLRGVTESLLKATEKLQNERKARKSLEQKFMEASQTGGFSLSLEPDKDEKKTATSNGGDGAIDFASLRAELKVDTGSSETPGANGNAEGTGTAMDEDDDDGPKMESLKEFLANTPKTNIDWSASAKTPSNATSTSTTTPSSVRSGDRVGVRLCRLLIQSDEMTIDNANEVAGMAGKYNLGGFIRTGQPGFIIVEGLEFNCDIFMDNLERHKKTFTSVGKVSERASRAFPMQLTTLTGEKNLDEFTKACESVGIKDKLDECLA
eukprot:CAMPEP_0113448228 /NCGR_PEP_ID=MMETSP0014_2-20120614/4655_1 /TAXON_ID=2857 /ORGANISM="Nitzschia sp." /LENGTH=741 /DNA_ID=CAMNT_0000339427 /DNA_START=350 /DNA_END=2575 /DNA_ORIENTATION=- /assembly_acc=CAM_ASM_000159